MTTHRKFWETSPRMNYAEWLNDFLKTSDYTAGDWTITNGGSPTIAVDTDAVGGVLSVATGGTDTNSSSHQNKIEAFRITPGKAIEFEARFALDDVTDSIFAIGLAVTDTTPLDAATRLLFKKEDGESTVSFETAVGGADGGSVPDFVTLEDGEFVKVGFYYDGSIGQDAAPAQPGATIDVFLNDRRVGAVPVDTDNPSTEMAITFHVVTGKTGAVAALIDYIRCVQER